MGEKKKPYNKGGKTAVIILWLIVIAVCFIFRDELTIERIVSFTPDNLLLAAIVMLGLFTLKGCTVCTNGDILYTASGVMFPLPMAVAVNLLGSLIMTTIPYWTGRKGGTDMLESLVEKHEKLRIFHETPRKDPFISALLLRLLGLIPCEIVSMYLGACNVHYRKYIGGTLLGLLPAALTFAFMGKYLSNPTSPQFLAAGGFQIVVRVSCLILGAVWKRNTGKKETKQS